MSAQGLWDALQRKRPGAVHKESDIREGPAGMVMIGSIESDLKALCQDKETRKKHSDLKDAAERATLKLRTFHSARGNNADQLSIEVLQSEQVLRPFLLACGTKNPQLTVLALGAIQRLFSLDTISARFMSTVLGALRMQAESTNEKVQVRVLQTLLQALSPRAIETTELLRGCLLQALGICFKLYNTKNPVIRHTAFAALRQVVELLFDQVQSQLQAAGWDSTESTEECNNAVLLFRDLCVLCNQSEHKSKPAWLTFAQEFPQTAALELLEGVLMHSEVLFRSSTLFATLLRLEMCPLLVNQLSTARDFPLVLRLMRTIRQVILGFHERLDIEAENFMCLLCKMLAPEKPSWTRILALELMYTLATEGRIMYYFFARQLRVTSAEKSVQNYFTALSAFLQQSVQEGAVHWRIHTGKTKGLQLLSETEPPIYPELYGTTLGVECLVQVVSSFAALTRDSNLPENASSYRLDFDKSSLHHTTSCSCSGSSSTPSISLPQSSSILRSASTSSLSASTPIPSATATLTTSSSFSCSSSPSAASQSASDAYLAAAESTPPLTGNIPIQRDPTTTPPSSSQPSPPPSPLRIEDSPSSSAPPSPSRAPLPPLLLPASVVTHGVGEASLTGDVSQEDASHTEEADITHELLTPEEMKTLADREEPTRAPTRRFLIDKVVLGELVTAALQPLLASLSLLLAKAENEDQVQHLLLAFQSYTHTSGMLGLSRPQDAFLSSLCGFAISTTIAREEGVSTAIRTLKECVEDDTSSVGKTPLLTPKNIQALKALFNISHSLGGLLGPSWLVVLETFQQLDTIIQICEELRASSDPSVMEWAPKVQVNRTELGLLKGALVGLFEATKYLDDGAVAHLLSALGNLSLTSLANAATAERGIDDPAERGSLNPRAVRMFALTNLISTFERNMFRVASAKLWEIAVGHLTCVVNHKNPQIRAYGVNALTRLVLKALGKKKEDEEHGVEESPRKRPEPAEVAKDEGLSFKPRADPHTFQHLLLEPFTDLYRSKYEDTKYDILEAVYSILQNTGQALQSGWPTILSIFQAVAAAKVHNRSEDSLNKEAQAEMSVSSSLSPSPTGGKAVERKAGYIAPASFIPLAFKSVLLITNDFLECIPYCDINFLIETIGWYGLQTDDTNISFTSIGLLWRVSDHLARFVGIPVPRRPLCTPPMKVPKHTSMSIHRDQRLQPLLARAGTKLEHPSSTVPATPISCSHSEETGEETETLSNELADQLMTSVFVQLYTLSTDFRSEVRNSACKTLFSTMAAHGERMAGPTCLQCLHFLVFPLLFDLMDSRETQTSVGASGQALGNDKGTGKKVMMMVHYSRDTPEKQWDESLVYALQGSARTFRLFMKTLSSKPELFDDWKRFLLAFEILITGFGTEVCTAALSAVQDALTAESATMVFWDRRDAWQELLPFYQRVVARAIVQLVAPDSPMGRPLRNDNEKDLSFPSVDTIVTSVPPGVERKSSAIPLATFLNTSLSISTPSDSAMLASPTPVPLSRFLNSPAPQSLSSFLGQPPAETKTPLSPLEEGTEAKEGTDEISEVVDEHGVATPVRPSAPLFESPAPVPVPTFSGQLSHLLLRLDDKHPRWEHWMKAFTHLLSSLQTILNSSRKLFTDQELADLLDIVYFLTKVADRGEKAPTQGKVTHRETPQQAASLKVLGSLAPVPAPLWPIVLRHVTSTVCGDAGMLGNHKLTQLPFTPSFIKQGQRMMVLLYCTQAPINVCIEHFEMVVSALHDLITFTSRGPTKYPDLCLETVQTLIKVASRGVDALNQAPLSRPNTAGDALRIWSLLADTISAFLAPLSDFPVVAEGEDGATGWEELQKALINALVQDILPQAQTAPQSILWRLINLLASSYMGTHPTPGTELLDQASLSGLFSLCQSEIEKPSEVPRSVNSSPTKQPNADLVIHTSERRRSLSDADVPIKRSLFEEGTAQGATSGTLPTESKPRSEVSVNIGLIACPLLVARCRVIVTSYLADEALGTMSRPRKEQLRFVLEGLGKLVLLRPVSASLGSNSPIPLTRLSERGLPKNPEDDETDEEEPQLTLLGQEPEAPPKGKPKYKPGRRRHLLELFPTLCDCVGLRDDEWKPILRDLLHLCAKELQLEH